MTRSYTPGPRRIAPRKNAYCVASSDKLEMARLEVLGKNKFEAISIGGGEGDRQIAIIPLDESNEANGRLIAAAPDLLEALKDMLEHSGVSKVTPLHVTAATRDRAIAAILKAEGVACASQTK